MPRFVSLSDAKAHLSSLVEYAAAGTEIVILKNGVPRARLVPMRPRHEPRQPARGMGVTYIASDFDAPDVAVATLFGTRM